MTIITNITDLIVFVVSVARNFWKQVRIVLFTRGSVPKKRGKIKSL